MKLMSSGQKMALGGWFMTMLPGVRYAKAMPAPLDFPPSSSLTGSESMSPVTPKLTHIPGPGLTCSSSTTVVRTPQVGAM